MLFLCRFSFSLLRPHFLNLSSIIERFLVKDAFSSFSKCITNNTLLLILLVFTHMSCMSHLWSRSIECPIILVELILFISRRTEESVFVCLEIRVLLCASVEAWTSIPNHLFLVKLVSDKLCLRISLFVQVRDIIEGSIIVRKTSRA